MRAFCYTVILLLTATVAVDPDDAVVGAARERAKAFKQWSDRHRDELKALVEIAALEKRRYAPVNDSRYLAVEALGRLANPDAAPVLIQNISWRYRTMAAEGSDLADYPCARALAAMGPSVVPGLLDHLASQAEVEVSDHTILVAKRVLRHIFVEPSDGGLEEAIAVTERFADRVSESRRVNIKRLLRELGITARAERAARSRRGESKEVQVLAD